MFGYLHPYKDELKLKDIKAYSTYYCALCNQIKNGYGRIWTLFLNYESVYILLFLESIINLSDEKTEFRCHLNPFMKKKCSINCDLLEYVAFVNMVLIVLKFKDDEYDEKKRSKRMLANLIEKTKKFKLMLNRYQKLYNDLLSQTELLRELENNSGTLDLCANTTANMLKSIIGNYNNNLSTYNEAEDIMTISFYIGKFIYVLDAYEDFERDKRKGQFNPLTSMYVLNGGDEEIFEKTKKILKLLKICIATKIKEINLEKNKEIITNILTYGIEYSVKNVEKNKKKRRKTKCTQRKL